MKNRKITALVLLCIVTVGLCGVFAYGMTGHNIYRIGYGSRLDHGGAASVYSSPQLVMEKEVSLDGIDNISVQYDMNSNDIFIYESENDMLTIREYSELDLQEKDLSTVTVKGSEIEVRGKRRNGNSFQIQIGLFGVRSAYCYTEIGLPLSYKGQLTLSTVSGDVKSQIDISLERDFKASSSSGDIRIPNITAPNVSLSSTSGDIEMDAVRTDVKDSTGVVTIETSSGDIDISQLTGEMEIESTSGEITVKQLTGQTKLKSSSGNIESETIAGDTQLQTTSGDIRIGQIEGTVTAESSSGRIEIREGNGDRKVKTTSGEIQLDEIAGAWDIRSSSGEIWLKAQEGSGSISTTSGDIELDLEKLAGDLRIDSSSGLVKIRLSQDNAFDFSADTSSGDIQTFFDKDLNFSKRGNSANGTYGDNQNGTRIVIGTTSGDVRVSGK